MLIFVKKNFFDGKYTFTIFDVRVPSGSAKNQPGFSYLAQVN